jgi:predicted small metal-binding protein
MIMLKYACRDLGVDCDLEATGATVEEVTQNVFAHAQVVHRDMLSTMTPTELAELNKSVISAIHSM